MSSFILPLNRLYSPFIITGNPPERKESHCLSCRVASFVGDDSGDHGRTWLRLIRDLYRALHDRLRFRRVGFLAIIKGCQLLPNCHRIAAMHMQFDPRMQINRIVFPVPSGAKQNRTPA